MSYTAKDWSQAITKLIQLTSNGTLTWQFTTDYNEDTWEIVDRAFSAAYNNSRYVVKAIRKKNYIDEDEFYWVSDAKLEIYKSPSITQQEMLISSSPETPVTGRLLSAVEASFAYQQGALSGLLDD